MDDLETDETSESIDVAVLMGFNSFGDQHRGKRRRYDGRTEEAVIDGGPSTSSDGKGKGKGNKSVGSGSNNLPLGHPKSRPRPKSSAAGADGPDGSGDATTARPRPDPGSGGAADEAAAEREGEGAGKIAAPERLSHVASRPDASARPPAPTSPSGPPLPPKPLTRTPGADSQAWELRRGVRLAGGDVAYYDVSFVEDPWRAWR